MRTAAVNVAIFAVLAVLAAGDYGSSPVGYTKVEPVKKIVVAAPKKIVVKAVHLSTPPPPIKKVVVKAEPTKPLPPPPTKKVIVEAKPTEVAKKVAPTPPVVSGGKKAAKPTVVAAPRPVPKSPAAPSKQKSSDTAGKTTGGAGSLIQKLLGLKKEVTAGLLKGITG